jgi:hypothetical protein
MQSIAAIVGAPTFNPVGRKEPAEFSSVALRRGNNREAHKALLPITISLMNTGILSEPAISG